MKNNRRNSAAADKARGSWAETKGRIKENWGRNTGNDRLAAEGKGDQMTGAAHRRKGQWKDRIKSWIDRI